MSGKKQKPHNQKRPPKNWETKQRILDRVGQSQFMRDQKDRRALEGNDWQKEDWGE
jgi:hypothetical protein